MQYATDDKESFNKVSRGAFARSQTRIVRSLIYAILLSVAWASIANAATFTVSKTADTNDGTCDADCSLREAIVAANLAGGSHTIAFNIPIGAGAAVISLGSALPIITRNNVVIDGTTQTTNIGDTNPVILGAGGNVGVEALPLSQVAGPEVEIRAGAVIANGLHIQANNVTVRGLAVLGFGAANGEGAIVIDNNFTGTLIEDNVLGSTAASFTDPGAALRNYAGVDSEGGDSGTIRDNLIGFGHRGVFLVNSSTGWTVAGNEIRDHELSSTDGDGIAIDNSSSNLITGNLITGSSSQGFVVTDSSLSDFVNNTVTGNGLGSTTAINQSAGITMRSGASSNDLDRNIIHANYGAGIQVNDGASGTRLTRNSFADNGMILSRDSSPVTGQIGIDLNAPGDDDDLGTAPFYTINDAADADIGGNGLRNFPVLDAATINGGFLTLTGWSQPGATIELFIAASDPSGFGEGETYAGTFVEGIGDTDPTVTLYGPGLINGLAQGTDTTNRFSFTVATPAGVVDGVELTATGTVGTDTSEFSGVVTAVAVHDVSGTVFEDITGNVLDGAEAIGDAVNPVVSGVDVYLYLDDGGSPGSPDATDTIQNGGAPVATDGSGVYTFSSILDGTYWVVVDSRTVIPAAGVHTSYLATTPWAEQTFGPDQGWCADGIGGTAERAEAGPCYGGVDGAADDDASALTSSEHIARVVVSGGVVSGVDFGFSYNVVTNVEPAGVVSLTASTYQGSLDQFIRNANAINGANAMRFVPAIPTNGAGGGGAWWRIDYTGSNIGETLGNTHDADTTIDGTAFDLADGVVVRNTNASNLGANAGGGLTVGVDDVSLPQVARPELEVMRSDSAVGVAFYFYSNATTGQIPNNFSVRDIAMWGFVGGVGMAGIAPMRPSGVVVERNVIGSPPNAFADPAVAGTLRGVALISTDGATIRDNLIGFIDTNGVSASAVTGTTISGNEIRDTGQVDAIADGVNYGGSSTTGTVTANLVVDAGGMGIDGTATDVVVANNTVTGSGQRGVQIGGIRQTGSGNTVRRNIVTGSAGPGVIVPDTVNTITVTENHFGGNGSLAIDVVAAAGDTAAGDGILLNDGLIDVNDGNDSLDYPIIDGAVLSGGNLLVTGFARAGVTIEFYEAVGAANDNNASGDPHGEGIVYLFTSTEGTADADATTGASYSDPGYGADPSVNRFSFTVPAPAGLSNGDEISATAFLVANGTSEFGPNAPVTALSPSIGSIVINELLYEEPSGGSAVNDEFIEIMNASAGAIDISGFRLTDQNLQIDYTFPAATTLAAGEYAVYWVGDNNAAHQAAGAAFQAWQGDNSRLATAGESVTLYDGAGLFVDFVAYDAGGPPPAPSLWDATYQASLGGAATSQSISLTPNGVDGDGSACWELTTSGDASGRCGGYLPTIDNDPGAAILSTGADNNAGIRSISGTIFVDTVGDGLADGPIGPAPNPFETGVRVELYRAGADGDADGGDDTYIEFTTSSAVDGSYSFTGLSADTYYVTVDSQGVDVGPYNGAYTALDTWAEQTYGPVGAARFDGVSTWTYAGTAGSFYGGAEWDVSDDHIPTNSLPTGEHIARVDTGAGNVNNVDFGFSFNVVTTTRGGSAVQDPGAGAGQRTVQGSLRQFITNANAQSGANTMRFVPAGPTNATLAGHNWWRVGITAQLPDMEDASTTVDGSAFNSADGVSPLNTNTAAIGVGAAVGVSGTFTTPTLDPEFEIQGDNVVNYGLFPLSTADNSAIRNVAISSFTLVGIRPVGLLPDTLDSLVIENNVIGASAASFTDNPALFVGRGIVARDLSNAIIRNNLIGWTAWGIQLDFDTVDTLVESNEIRGIDTWGIYLNGSAGTGQQAARITMQGNLIESSVFDGIRTPEALSEITINQNTLRFNSYGVRLWGANNSVTGNIISDNSNTGLLLVGDGLPAYPAPSANLISQNQFGNNGLLGIDLVESGINQDGVTLNDDGDIDVGANTLLNYPIIESAQITGPNLVINGFVAAGASVEFYIADADPTGFGEGVNYLFTAVEGSAADTDATSASYGPGPINGLSQGSDTSNRYTFTVPTPGGVGVGTDLTASATAASTTSEFSGRATVSNDADLVITKVLDPSTPGPFAEGDAVTYLLTVTNNGPAQATNVTATDTYPTELTLGVPVPSAPTTYVAGTGVWSIGTLNNGASATLTLPGTVNAGTAGDVVTNSVTAATGDQPDPTPAADDLVETFTVLPFLSIDDVSQAETNSVPGTTTFTFTVSINQAIGTDVTFDFDTADNTATVADSDYVAIAGGNGTVLAGATTTTIDITVNGDDNIEADETFFVDLSNVVGAAVADAQGQGTISDDDSASVSIAATTDANEAGPVDGQFTVTQSTTSATNTVITYTVAGTAIAGGTDYTSLSGSVTVLAGDTTATIDVTGIVADALVEGIETVIVTLTATDNPGITLAASPNDTATVNILDSDSANVLIASTTDGNEAGPVDGQFTVTQSITSATDTVITYTIAGTAIPGGTDYSSLSGLVTVLAGDTTATIDVTGIVADALVEGIETVIVTLTGTNNSGITVAASPNDTATVNILDNNAATVSIAATTDGDESGPIDGVFTLTQTMVSSNDTVLNYSVAGTATSGSDYNALSGTVTILGGSTTATIVVPVIDDTDFDGGIETVIVTLTAITASDPGVTIDGAADNATVNIIDNDTATLSIAGTTNGNETGPVDAVFTVTQSTDTLNDTVISYTTAGTATSGSDYNALSGTVTIPGGTTTATINVSIIDDALAEGIAETLDVTLVSITASDPGISIAASPADGATVTISDNDADLITTKTVSNAAPSEGDTITYTIVVTNSAGAQATNVSLTDILPAGVTYVSDDSAGNYNSASGIWSIGTLDSVAPSNVATLNITATVDAGASSLAQPITNTTTAAVGDQTDPDATSDTLSANITVDANADLVTTKVVDIPSPVENATITYTISVFNNGAAQATNVSLIDLLPPGVTYFADDSGGAYNPVTGVWTIGTIDNGAIATLNIMATVDTGAGALAQPISNVTTAAAGDQPDPDATTDDLSEDITINYNADLVTTKAVDNLTPLAGDTIVYTLSVTNNGPAPATNVSLTDLLPLGVTYASDDGAGAYDDVSGLWVVGDLANGATAILNISANVDAGAGLLPQPITNMTTAAVGDQIDPDAATDNLTADINVSLIDPNLIQLTKAVGRNRANAGEIVTYSIEVRNTTANPIGPVRVSDTPARGFKYVPGTTQLNGVSIPDPNIGLPIGFDIGAVPGHVDSNGNGAIDPGEPGYLVLSYRMVAGSGVAPGVWTNTAIATVACDTCFVSNTASADIEIIEDTLFDLGTLIGKVFYDADRDGFQDSGEAGIAAAMVALDDGSYVLTDEFGRYHFPAVKPGQRLLKINLNSLVGQATATNDKTRIVNVTPGLMAKANFGVIIETVDESIGSPGQFGIAVDSDTSQPPVLINGSSLMPSLLVNGAPVSLGTANIQLGTQQLEDVIELGNGKLMQPIRFRTEIDVEATAQQWKIVVSGARGEIVYSREGTGSVPAVVEWDGIRKNGKLIRGGGIYTYYLMLTTSDGQSLSSGRRLFGVNRRNSISLNLAGGAFVSGSHVLTSEAKVLLTDTAKAIRSYPDEIIVISGHTDSVGSDASNMLLAERRAHSAYDYLHTVEGISEDQFVIQAFGESRPIASNDTAWGRELNRRVEISGDLSRIDLAKNYDPYRQRPVVRIADTDVAVDDSGSFRTEIDLEDEQETMAVLLSTPQGGRVETEVRLPTLRIVSPRGQFAIPIDNDVATPLDLNATPNDLALVTELHAQTEVGNTVEFNGEPLEVDADGHFSAQLTLRAGDNYFGLVARNPMGMLRIANLKLTVDDSGITEPVIVVEPIPQLALQLPPPGIPMTNANLVIPGSTAPGNRVFINDNEVSVDADGTFITTIELNFGDNPFIARVVDSNGYSGQIEQTLVYNGNPIFFMALVDGTFSKLQTSGSLEAAGKDKRDESISEGRIAYYFKGHVLGKYLLTSAFDSGRQELGDLFSDLAAQDNDRLLTNLDPETLYPVYGDSSTLVYDAQSQSKFYLALESETVTALIGNYALNFTDTELAGYQRTLYGASATFQSEAKDEAGNSKTKAQAFHAKIEQAHVRDELRATGGSLYYLSQRDIIEGSEHISVIVRDQDSGLILRRTALLQGLDYSIDYFDGRLLTNRPISSFSADSSLIGSDLLGGSAVYLQIDYETTLDGFEQTASGARVRQGIGERLTVGATAVDEDQLGGQYSLKAGDAEYRLGRKSRLVAEYAASEGNNSLVNISEDGGLSYQPVIQAAGSSGDAYKIAAEIDAGEWFGFDDRLLLNTYFKHLDTGFSANSVSSEQGSEKSGIGASWKISDTSSLLGRYERQIQLIDGSENTLGTLQWNMVRKTWGIAAEIEDREGYAGDATIAALRMSYRWTDALSTSLEHQQTVDGLDNDQSTLGVAYRATDKLTLDASATHGTIGDSAQLGAQLDWRGNRLYVAQQINDLPASGFSNNRLVGVEAPFGPDGAIYSEYHWSDLPSEQQQQTMIGVRQRFAATDGLQIEVSGEHSAENAISGNSGERFALSIGANFANDSGVRFSTRNEYRKDSRSIASEQFLSTSNLELALGDNLAALGKYRFSKSESSTQLSRDIDFTEASIGLAYRPVENDRLNLLARYSRLTNTPTEFQLADVMTGLSSDIFAVDWSYQLSQRIEWVGKQALRWSEEDDDPLELRSRTSLSIQRLNWSMPKKFLLGTEYRLMSQDLADDHRSGFVTEVLWEGLNPLRLGVGYNFSDVSDNEYVDYDFSTKGLFMRVQGKF